MSAEGKLEVFRDPTGYREVFVDGFIGTFSQNRGLAKIAFYSDLLSLDEDDESEDSPAIRQVHMTIILDRHSIDKLRTGLAEMARLLSHDSEDDE